MREYSPKINKLESKEDCSLLFKLFFWDNGNFIDIFFLKKNQVSQVYREYTTGDNTISNASYINQ